MNFIISFLFEDRGIFQEMNLKEKYQIEFDQLDKCAKIFYF